MQPSIQNVVNTTPINGENGDCGHARVPECPATPSPVSNDGLQIVESISAPRMSLSPKSKLHSNFHSKVSFDLNHNGVLSCPDPVVCGDGCQTTVSSTKENQPNPRASGRMSVLKCRICLDYEKSGEQLLSPCRCKGTVGLMHSTCLEQWIESSGKEQCEICKCNYDMRRKKPTFAMWFQRIVGQKSFIGDLLCFCFLVPCTVIAVYYCIKAAMFLFSPEGVYSEFQAQWRGMGLVVLCMILVFCLVIWMVFTIRHYVRDFYVYQQYEFRYSIHNRRRSTVAASELINN